MKSKKRSMPIKKLIEPQPSSILLDEDDLKTQLLKILTDGKTLPNENEQPILGTRLLEKIKPKLKGNFSENSIKNYFSQLSKNENSPIAKTTQGFGYFRRKTTSEVEIDSEVSTDKYIEIDDESDETGRDNQLEEKFRATYINWLESEREKFPAHIEHTKSTRSAKGLNTWKFPDVVTLLWNIGIKNETNEKTELELDSNLLEIKKAIGDPPFNLISSELKVNLTMGNFRPFFFQCVSNSKWAHEAHLVVACEINDSQLEYNLRKLGISFGVSIISFQLNEVILRGMPSAEQIRNMNSIEKDEFLSKYCGKIKTIHAAETKESLDWDHIEDVKTINSDFNDIFKWVSRCLKDNRAYTLSAFRAKEEEEEKDILKKLKAYRKLSKI